MEALQREHYDLVLMDCETPVMDGFRATVAIRATMQPGIPIIALTADCMQATRDRCLGAGMNDYLSKPTDLGQLADVITRWLPVPSDEMDKTSLPPASEAPVPAILDAPAPFAFNAEDLLRRLRGDRQLAGTVVQGFLKQALSQLSGLRKQLDEEDVEGFRLQARTLSGASATVGAKGLHALAEAMEQAGKAGQLDQGSELLPRAVDEFQRYKSTLQRAGWA
jgi:two-component system sensor histidine kinase/response regulator